MMNRRLVTVRPVKAKHDIPKADMIEQLTVDGWNVVSKKNEFNVGDYGVFFEVDSGLPAEDERFEFLLKGGTKDFHGKQVIRIKTMKLRGVVSQGLMLPLSKFPEIIDYIHSLSMNIKDAYEYKLDLSHLLDVVKYEPPMKVRGADAAGDFPYYIHRTDQERINNVFEELKDEHGGQEFYATLKMDGSSATFYYTKNPNHQYQTYDTDDDGGQFIVCSRNMAIKPTNNPWYVAAESLDIERKLKEYSNRTGNEYAIQGELLGKGIQGTREKFYDYTVRFFAVFDVTTHKYLPYNETIDVFDELDLPMVPVLDTFKPFERFNDVQEFIEYSNNVTPIHADVPEGVVYHSVDKPYVSFKAISSTYLLKYE